MDAREISKMVQLPSVCEAGCGDVVEEDDWHFLPAFKKEQKNKGLTCGTDFVCNV